MLKKSKGVTPVVATVLLVFIAVAAVGSAAVFLEGAVGGVQEGAESQLEREERIDNSDLRIQNGFNNTDGDLNVVVRNSDSVTLPINEDGDTLFSVFVNNRPNNAWTVTGGEDEIDPNQIVTLDLNEPYPAVDSSKSIRIAAPYETSDSYVCYNTGDRQC